MATVQSCRQWCEHAARKCEFIKYDGQHPPITGSEEIAKIHRVCEVLTNGRTRKIEITGKLKEGSLGNIYLAKENNTNWRALKISKDALLDYYNVATLRERLSQFQAISKNYPSMFVMIYEFDFLLDHNPPILWIYMEYLEEGNLNA